MCSIAATGSIAGGRALRPKLHFSLVKFLSLGYKKVVSLDLKSQITSSKYQIISKSEIPITETFRPLQQCSLPLCMFGILNFSHWYLFEIWFLVLVILAISFSKQLLYIQPINYFTCNFLGRVQYMLDYFIKYGIY